MTDDWIKGTLPYHANPFHGECESPCVCMKEVSFQVFCGGNIIKFLENHMSVNLILSG